MTYSYPKMTYSDPKMTYIDPKVTHTPHITKYPYWSNIPLVILNYLPLTLQAINIVIIKRSVGRWGNQL